MDRQTWATVVVAWPSEAQIPFSPVSTSLEGALHPQVRGKLLELEQQDLARGQGKQTSPVKEIPGTRPRPAVRKGRRSALPRPCARLMGLVGRRGGGVPGWAPIVSATAPSVSQITFYTCQGGSSSQLRGCVRHLVTPSKQRGGLGACPGVTLEPVLGWPQSLFWCGLR